MQRKMARQLLAKLSAGVVVALLLMGCGAAAPGPSGAAVPTAAPSPATPQAAGQVTPPAGGASQAPASSGRSSDPGAIASRFDESRAMESVRTLAQPEFMGRHSGTPGETLGAQFLSNQFQSSGLKPAGDKGTYVQQFPMTVTEFTTVPELTRIDQAGGEHPLQLRDHFRPLIGGPAGPGAAEGPGVFAGTGEFSNVDVRDKIALVVPRVRLSTLVNNARDAGAIALVLTTGEETILKGENQQPNSGATMPVFLVSTRGAAALLEGSGHSRDELNTRLRAGQSVPSFPLAFRLRLDSQVESHPIVAKNVIALLPAASASEDSCIVGAHYEEIGPDPDGVVFPAANDNGSGTAVMLEIARLVAAESSPPRVNVLFIGWSGHEEGLLGSEYYVKNPVLPLPKTECYINLDTVGQGGGKQLLAGTSDSRMRSAIEASVRQLEAATGARPPVGISSQSSGASDYLNFEDRGVATIDFNWSDIIPGGNIHVPGDDANNVDPAKLKVTGEVAAGVLLNLVGGQ